MKKSDLAEKVYQNIPSTKQKALGLIDEVFDIMKDTLEDGEHVNLSGFGKFSIRAKTSRPGRNPQTGEDMTITARRVLTFKPSHILREKMNEEAI